MLLDKETVCGVLLEELSHASEKKVRVKCEMCQEIRIVIWHNYTLAQKRKGDTGETICLPCHRRGKVLLIWKNI